MKFDKEILIASLFRILYFMLFISLLLWIFHIMIGDYIEASETVNEVDKELLIRFFSTFIIMIVGISAGISYVGGWLYLSKKLPEKEYLKGLKVRGRSLALSFGYLPPASYSNCIKIYVSDKGAHLKSQFIFRLFHPPIFIPWDKMEILKFKKRWIFYRLKLRVEKNKVWFFGKAAVEIYDHLKSLPNHSLKQTGNNWRTSK